MHAGWDGLPIRIEPLDVRQRWCGSFVKGKKIPGSFLLRGLGIPTTAKANQNAHHERNVKRFDRPTEEEELLHVFLTRGHNKICAPTSRQSVTRLQHLLDYDCCYRIDHTRHDGGENNRPMKFGQTHAPLRPPTGHKDRLRAPLAAGDISGRGLRDPPTPGVRRYVTHPPVERRAPCECWAGDAARPWWLDNEHKCSLSMFAEIHRKPGKCVRTEIPSSFYSPVKKRAPVVERITTGVVWAK